MAGKSRVQSNRFHIEPVFFVLWVRNFSKKRIREVIEMSDYKNMIVRGYKPQAVLLYQKRNHCFLLEAKKAMDELEYTMSQAS